MRVGRSILAAVWHLRSEERAHFQDRGADFRQATGGAPSIAAASATSATSPSRARAPTAGGHAPEKTPATYARTATPDFLPGTGPPARVSRDQLRQRLTDDRHVWAAVLFDETVGLGFDRSFATFTKGLSSRRA